MRLLDIPVYASPDELTTLGAVLEGGSALVVNVASKCGLTPQYQGLQSLHDSFQGRGFTVVAFPCNQFGGQEPGHHEDITDFCSLTYGVTFPVLDKVDVNGPAQHAVWEQLTDAADAEGRTGEVEWNFEKFLVSADGCVVRRFGPLIDPASAEVRAAVEQLVAS